VSDIGQIDRVLKIARNASSIGFGLMLRDPGHDAEVVRHLGQHLLKVEVPSNVLPVANGGRMPGIDGVHWPSAHLLDLAGRRVRDSNADQSRHQFQGASVHDTAELRLAEALSVDYATVGPVFPPTEKMVDSTLGLEGLGRLCLASSIPLFALGGITSKTAAECLVAGAYGIAAISWFQREPIDTIVESLTMLFAS
jgi:hypothetical protein